MKVGDVIDRGDVLCYACSMFQSTSLLDLPQDQLVALLAGWNQPRYRAIQVWDWLYKQLATDPAEMTNLPKELRERLAAEERINPLAPVYEQRSSDGQTIKWLFRLPDGLTIETVLMLYEERRTVCISTQAGCAMGCVFCATGQAGLARNLTAGEIVAQVLAAARWLAIMDERRRTNDERRKTKLRISAASFQLPVSSFQFPASSFQPPTSNHLTNVVVMGMGEPLANYDRTWQALRTLTAPDGFGLGARHITVSTVGLVPGIRSMAAEPLQINLAVSLHAPNDALRTRLVPINHRYPIAEVMAAVRDYVTQTHRRVTFEYALMSGINDSPAVARELAALLRGLLCHVNLIPLNPVAESPYQPTSPEHAAGFQVILEKSGIPATLRLRRGIDIDAGCGQLRRRVANGE
ncbi:MAG: 23S rRNA (adenine(2503)-C(2))-methyltransferase RlmN [Chloroflexi bacterium]|nr:23S rRNA (adenine(2503)-C(2))-methyltransferase RlmN [Chloroflexota bacterium]